MIHVRGLLCECTIKLHMLSVVAPSCCVSYKVVSATALFLSCVCAAYADLLLFESK